ncbi:MAG: circadian clock protein KaiC, partial [Planctomycetaceae bacterium]|nr:circadian clock protein KaiC [Planctomycetaceae bacterium]
HRVTDQMSTRRLRIVKYRGTSHETNEYPFLIDEAGISVLPVTSLGLQHVASTARISSGIPRLDVMLGGEGYFRGSTVLMSGTAGSGKSSIAAHFAVAACRRGERCLYFAFEESPGQILRNMRSIGIDLEPWVNKGLLKFHASRASIHGLEMHLATIHKLVREFQPHAVVMDPIGSLIAVGERRDASVMLTKLIDFLKMREITALLTYLTSGDEALEQTNVDVSTLADTWLLLRDLELDGERNRVMYVLKSRGMAHSNQLREFLLTDQGVELQNVYLGAEGVLTGSARLMREATEKAGNLLRHQGVEAKQRERVLKREAQEARIIALQKEFEAEEEVAKRDIDQEKSREETHRQDRDRMGISRQGDKAPETPRSRT